MELPLIQRREIEAGVIAPVIQALGERFGREAVLETLGETIKQLAREHGASIAKSMDRNDIRALADVLRVWNEDGALETDLLRDDGEHFDFNVTRCKFAEMYHRLGIPELGPILSCNRDFCFAEGFNADLELERKQTLMEGASCCDFRFRKKG